jgi:hypothetical protein
MATDRQILGAFGEDKVVKTCACPRCKKSRTLKLLPKNFKCADVICDFCGYLAQVKAAKVTNIETIPNEILGAAWGPQRARMDAAIYFPLFLVLAVTPLKQFSIFYLSADLQTEAMFESRTPLSAEARRAGWQGFKYNLRNVKRSFVRLV